MKDFSLFERISTIFQTIFSSAFFISLFVILVFSIVILILNIKIKSKVPRYVIGVCYAVVVVFVLGRYGNYVISMNDSVAQKFSDAVYFPNIIVYISMLVITVLLLIMTFVKKKLSLVNKVGNIASFSVIWFLFVLVLDTAKNNDIDFYDMTSIYSDQTLMILLQSSMGIFMIWVSIMGICGIIKSVAYKLDNKNVVTASSNIAFDTIDVGAFDASAIDDGDDDDIGEYSDEDFVAGYLNPKLQSRNEEINDILKYK